MNEKKAKKLGCCSLCDTEIRDVVSTYSGGPLDGQPAMFGSPKLGSKRSTVVLTGGSLMDFSLCGRCQLTPDTLPVAWRKALLAMSAQLDVQWLRDRDLHDARRDAAERRLKTTMGIATQIPLGVMFTRRWQEIDNARSTT